jgi:hypothetical protein
MQDISTARRVMVTLLKWLDANNRWEKQELVEVSLTLHAPVTLMT